VEQLGQSGRVHCLERSEDVGSYLATATVFVLPSLSESMPNTLLEAVRIGLPCIGTHVGAVPDILGSPESPCGLVVPPGDIPALADAMRRVVNEPELRASLAVAALKQGDAYKPEKRIALVESIYTQLLRKKGLL
jgi:glycosyltransferase involved in cell wall biosynthesis